MEGFFLMVELDWEMSAPAAYAARLFLQEEMVVRVKPPSFKTMAQTGRQKDTQTDEHCNSQIK